VIFIDNIGALKRAMLRPQELSEFREFFEDLHGCGLRRELCEATYIAEVDGNTTASPDLSWSATHLQKD